MGLRETLERLAKPDLSGDPDVMASFDLEVGPLLDSIQSWLSADDGDRAPVATRSVMTLHETGYAPRAMPALDIDVDGLPIEVRPVGALIVGASGRVDIHPAGEPDNGLMVLLDRGGVSGWQASWKGEVRFSPFDNEVLISALGRLSAPGARDPNPGKP